MGDLIRLSDLTLGYRRRPAVHHVSGGFAEGSLTAVVGPNGAGKSTLLKGLVGLLPPLGGRIDRFGLTHRDLAYLPQQAEIDRRFPMSVRDCVLMGHWHRVGPFGRLTERDRVAADEALAAVGLDGFAKRPVGQLSAGQFQRVLFARMLLQDARLILLDEPFNALDAKTTADLLSLVARWHGERRTVVAVLHDLEQVRGHFPDCLLLARDAVAWGPTERVLTPDHLARARVMAEGWSADAAACGRAA